jgi:SAM-dependent methyltransferase
MSQSWTSGYVADIPYLEGFYIQQSPSHMALACLLGNVAVDLPEPGDEACYLELGCGAGIGALLTAAANPRWKVVAVDYNPAHIALGIGLARAARLDNIRFIEADLAQLAGSADAAAIPTADFVTMHGLWTWVGPDVRAGIVRLLATKTRPGGLVHVSYNALPAWQGAIGLQRLIYQTGLRAGGRSDKGAEAGLALARELKELGAKHLIENSVSLEVMENLPNMPKEYLSHEYMNAHWSPVFHADVAAALAEAKLDWVASAYPLENFPDLTMTPEQRKLVDRHSDPLMRELIKDTCLHRQFRHDVYMRGARRMSNAERDAALGGLTLTPLVSLEELRTELEVPIGRIEVGDSLKKLMAAALRGPTTVRDLLAREPGSGNAPEAVSVLVGSHQCEIAMRPDGTQSDGANRLNRLLGARIRNVADAWTTGLASSRLGTAMTSAPLLQFITARMLDGETEADAKSWLEALSPGIKPEKLGTVRDIMHKAIEQRIPILRQLQIVPE